MHRLPLSFALAAVSASLLGSRPVLAQDYVGAWDPPFQHDTASFTVPPPKNLFNGIHLALIPVGPNRGKVFAMDQEVHEHSEDQGGSWIQRWSIVDVSNPGGPTFENHVLELPDDEGDLFCSGHAWLPDGKLFVAGGSTQYLPQFFGGKLALTWDPMVSGNDSWTLLPNMIEPRWYPTVTLLGDGRVAVSAGTPTSSSHPHDDYEVFDFTTNRWTLYPGPDEVQVFDIYPRSHVLTSGDMFIAGFKEYGATYGPDSPWYGMSIMDEQRIYGTSIHIKLPGIPDVIAALGGINEQALNSVEWCTPSSPNPVMWQWRNAPPMNHARQMLNAVILPDSTILAVGGIREASTDFVRIPEVYADFAWHEQPMHETPRDYHSTALLMPDGTVLSAAGDRRRFDYQIFRPHYLLSGKERPVITSAPDELDYQNDNPQVYDIQIEPLESGVAQQVVMMRAGSVTHHNDYDQRMIVLSTVGGSSTGISFGAPKTANDAPPGYYMIFVLSDERMPSVAHWVHID